MEKTTIHKIPLNMLIGMLSHLYEQGVDFVDIICSKKEGEDHLGVSIQNNYLADNDANVSDIEFPNMNFHRNGKEEEEENEEEEIEIDLIDKCTPLKEDELNDLII